MKNSDALTATILEIQRMSTEDGPGLRTTVFFKGCTLKCTWCHNPESISMKPQVQWVRAKCIGCNICEEVCREKALIRKDNEISFKRELCTGCGTCVGECPSTALELMGQRWSVADLVSETVKDKSYFDKSSGGITASGGEATMQAPFVEEFFKKLRERGISTALDTCGQCSWQALERVIPHADIVLFDVKEIDPQKHRTFTGSSNDVILSNLERLCSFIDDHILPGEIWIRTPIIPGATDSLDNIAGIGSFIAEKCKGKIKRWELCSFNNLCRDKYHRLNREWQFSSSELVTKDTMEELAECARSSGVDSSIVCWSGTTRIDEDIEQLTDGKKIQADTKFC